MIEIVRLKKIGYHAHILGLLGCVTDPSQPMVLTELCPQSLLRLLRTFKESTLAVRIFMFSLIIAFARDTRSRLPSQRRTLCHSLGRSAMPW